MQKIKSKKPKTFPRTKLGRRLWELRQKIILSGLPSLSWDDIEKEVKERRENYEKNNYQRWN